MKNKLIASLAGIVLTTSIVGCTKSSDLNWSDRSTYKGYEVEFGNNNGREFLRMWGGASNRGYRPATLFAEDTDSTKPGFEYVRLKDAEDLSETSIDDVINHSDNMLRDYATPLMTHRMYAFLAVGK